MAYREKLRFLGRGILYYPAWLNYESCYPVSIHASPSRNYSLSRNSQLRGGNRLHENSKRVVLTNKFAHSSRNLMYHGTDPQKSAANKKNAFFCVQFVRGTRRPRRLQGCVSSPTILKKHLRKLSTGVEGSCRDTWLQCTPWRRRSLPTVIATDLTWAAAVPLDMHVS